MGMRNRKENRNLKRNEGRSWNSSRSKGQLLSWLLFVVKGVGGNTGKDSCMQK
jgi:hypothetical protein